MGIVGSAYDGEEFSLDMAEKPDETLWLKFKNGLEDLALSAYLHLVLPVSLYFSLTYGATNKPTEMSTVKFPGGTFFFCFWRTGLDFPTGFSPISGFFHGHEK
jgi:hypothetical protein